MKKKADFDSSVETGLICSICSRPIDSLFTAISEENGGYSHFDCVINELKERYHVEPPDTVSYVGQGKFAVVSKDSSGKFVFKERIEYESPDSFDSMKKKAEEVRQEVRR